MDYRRLQAEILALLEESPIKKNDIRTDIRELVYAGEIALAFDTLCSWLYEDSLAISPSFYKKLVALSEDLEVPSAVERLDELVVHGSEKTLPSDGGGNLADE